MKQTLLVTLQDILSSVKMASHLVEDGKEVRADRQLQGVRTKLVHLIEWIVKDCPETLEGVVDNNVAEENNS